VKTVRSTVNIFLQEHIMKKKVLLLLVLATLIAGGAFAQKVGDTANVFGKNYTVKEIRNGEVILILTPTLDGTWQVNAGVTAYTFNGNAGVYKQISSSGLYQDAVKKGYIKVGGQAFRNLKKTDGLTWSGQQLVAYANNNNPDVAIKADWVNITITINPDGKTLQVYMGAAANDNYVNLTRQ
jgi:hypothetical protein